MELFILDIISVVVYIIIATLLIIVGKDDPTNKTLLFYLILNQLMVVSIYVRTGTIRSKQEELQEEIRKLKQK